MPTPVTWIATGELNCALTIDMIPETLPVVVGAKEAVSVKLLPGDRVNGSDAPATLKPVPVALAWEIVTELVPEFVTVRLWLLVDPTGTFPKLIAAGLIARLPDDAVSEVAEVVELPLAVVTPVHPD